MGRVHPSTIALVRVALNEDIGRGDITSLACLEPERVHARITAKSDGILSGTVPATIAFAIVDSANTVTFNVQDGEPFGAGQAIAEIDGLNQTVLTAERTALNFLAHLSGIATLTGRFVKAVAGTGCTILDTRKTTPGWRLLEKEAVIHGGGANHRLGLHDMILIKDNHIAAAGSVGAAVARAREYLRSGDCRFQFGSERTDIDIEVEVTAIEQLTEAIGCGVTRLLLDNQSPASLADLVKAARQLKPAVKLEASGGIRLDNVAAIAAAGVDFVSIGALTHSAPASDFSLNITAGHETKHI